jgi:hypothetical protein
MAKKGQATEWHINARAQPGHLCRSRTAVPFNQTAIQQIVAKIEAPCTSWSDTRRT